MNKRIGEIWENNQGLKMKIIRYNTCEDLDVIFEDGYISKGLQYSNVKRGRVKNPNAKDIFGVACFGVGEYDTIKDKNCYMFWKNMLVRCYNTKAKENLPTYENCVVCEEWHNFQNFAKWFYKNYNIFGTGKMNLDKDILIKNNKVYSPETCIFVDNRINILFVRNELSRGSLPIGVTWNKDHKKYAVSTKTKEGRIKMIYCSTVEEAFYAYKEFKERYIKQVADEYKKKYANFPERLYKAMYDYVVEITD